MPDRPFMNASVQELEVTARVAEDEIRNVWTELRHRKSPTATELSERIASLASEIVEEVTPPELAESSKFGVYVIELDAKVLRSKKFMAKNSKTYLPGRDCLYVGHTQLTAEQRFLQHLEGEHGSPIVRRFGLRLRPEFFAAIDRFETRQEAMVREEQLGELLRAEGYGVWYN